MADKIFLRNLRKGVDKCIYKCYNVYTRLRKEPLIKKDEVLKMKTIVMNTLAKVNKNSTLDEIKKAMKAECAKVDFEITNNDWNDMFNDVLCSLA